VGYAGFDVAGRTAVVTGASSGIGEALARGLAQAGARIVLAARRLDRLEALTEELVSAGVAALAVPCDVRSEAEVDALVAATLDRFGAVDVLVNNAGVSSVSPAEDESMASWSQVLSVNLTGAFLCAQRFGRPMLAAGRGSIINVASVVGLRASRQIPQASYAAAKGALINLTRELAVQWARRGVRVNAIAPGWFETEMTQEMFSDESGLGYIRRHTPMGRPGELPELVGPVLFLASDAASYVTGQILPVDGGWTGL
jgi:NAD(P)-dependent dehydrogenase (short-subunit alcohol dehydrogenase family)